MHTVEPMKSKRIRKLPLVAALCLSGSILFAQTPASATVAQLEESLRSKQAAQETDADLAAQLSTLTLTEQLTRPALARIEGETRLGPKASDQLRLLAAISILQPPPAAELPTGPMPDEAAQQRIIQSALQYVNESLHRLPDFLATRETFSFDDIAVRAGKHRKPKAVLHFVGAHEQEIAYRNGAESDALKMEDAYAPAPAGLSTWGEFGPVLKIVLGDSFEGSVTWSRWQKGETATEVAVFRYIVPEGASHYLIDVCCEVVFRRQPGYQGEIAIDPATGVIDRITVEPDLPTSAPISDLGIAVQYGRAEIGGVEYVCPSRGIATTTIRIADPEVPGGFSNVTYVNEVSFVGYHKFGSTARMVSDNPEAAPR
jgi:hypothetical protein